MNREATNDSSCGTGPDATGTAFGSYPAPASSSRSPQRFSDWIVADTQVRIIHRANFIVLEDDSAHFHCSDHRPANRPPAFPSQPEAARCTETEKCTCPSAHQCTGLAQHPQEFHEVSLRLIGEKFRYHSLTDPRRTHPTNRRTAHRRAEASSTRTRRKRWGRSDGNGVRFPVGEIVGVFSRMGV
jgi:hypothetical protein